MPAAVVLGIVSSWMMFCWIFPAAGRAANGWCLKRWFRTKHKWSDTIFSAKSVAGVSGIITAYGTAERRWGSAWQIFTQHSDAHKLAKAAIEVVLVVLAVGTYFREKWKEENLARTEALLKEFLDMVARIVQQKILRFAERARSLPNTKIFHHITQPKDQLRIIFNESAVFIEKVFKISPDQIDLSIIERKNDGAWSFYITHQTKWQHSEPNRLFEVQSSARKAIETGHDVFQASKKLGAANEEYDMGERDKAHDDGSIYCSRVIVECKGTKWSFVVSIVTYGAKLCEPHDEYNEQKTKSLLREIVRRIELELHLRAIKAHDQ
jgi:hypothetical protein